MQKFTRSALASVFVVSAAGSAALAHSGASGIVKNRMDMMRDIAAQMKQIGAIIKGEAAFDAASVRSAANRVAVHAGEMPKLFPERSTEAPSEALPSIWRDWGSFSDLAADLED